MKMSYEKLIKFGNTPTNALQLYNNDSLTYCIGTNASQAFNHGSNASIYGQNSNPCQVMLSQRCAKDWDDVCEYASSFSANNEYANRADTMSAGLHENGELTPGEVLLLNTAREKYRIAMHGCELRSEPFDPINPASPYISYYVGRDCVAEYAVDPGTIDQDIVMNKILEKPRIAMNLLLNIKNTMIRLGQFNRLLGTRLGAFYGLSGGQLKESFTLSQPTIVSNIPSQQLLLAPTDDGLPTSPYVIPTVSGLVPAQYIDWWPTEYVDFWPNEYDGAWGGSYGGGWGGGFNRRRGGYGGHWGGGHGGHGGGGHGGHH